MWIEPQGASRRSTRRGNTEAHRLQDPSKWVPFGVGAIEGTAGAAAAGARGRATSDRRRPPRRRTTAPARSRDRARASRPRRPTGSCSRRLASASSQRARRHGPDGPSGQRHPDTRRLVLRWRTSAGVGRSPMATRRERFAGTSATATHPSAAPRARPDGVPRVLSKPIDDIRRRAIDPSTSARRARAWLFSLETSYAQVLCVSVRADGHARDRRGPGLRLDRKR